MALCPFGKRGNRVTEECPGSRVRSGRAWVWAPLGSTQEDSGSRAWTPRRRDPVWLGTGGSHSHPANDTSLRTCFHTHVSGGPGKKGRPPGSKLGSSHPPRPCRPPAPIPRASCPFIGATEKVLGLGAGSAHPAACLARARVSLPWAPCFPPRTVHAAGWGAHQDPKGGFRASRSPGYWEHSLGCG